MPMPQGGGYGTHNLGGPSRITGANLIGRSEVSGVGHSDQLKFGGAGVAGSTMSTNT